MSVTVVPGDDNIVPLVVIKGAVTVSFDHIGTISKVKHIVYVPVRENNRSMTTGSLKWFHGDVCKTNSGGFESPMLNCHHTETIKAGCRIQESYPILSAFTLIPCSEGLLL